MSRLDAGDRELVRIVCNDCGHTIGRVVRDEARQLVLIRCMKRYDLGRSGGAVPFDHAIHVWERLTLNEDLIIQFRARQAKTKLAATRTYCPLASCDTQFSISHRLLAAHLDRADRRGRCVRWKLDADSRDVSEAQDRLGDMRLLTETTTSALIRRIKRGGG